MRIQKYLLALAAIVLSGASVAEAADPYALTERWANQVANQVPWHGAYQHIQYGQPLAVVVPPTAHMRQTFSWGVSQNTNHPIYHQYGRNYPGYGFAPAPGFLHAPAWPSHTDQFGSYYVRGPW